MTSDNDLPQVPEDSSLDAVSDGGKVCPSCGISTEDWSHACPKCGYEWQILEDRKLWNPLASAGWSLLFSPLFGAILLDRNWRVLDQKDQARWTRLLFWLSASAILFGFIVAPIDFTPGAEKTITGISKIIGISLTGACFTIGRHQKRFLAESGRANYPKKSWSKPIAFGVVGLVAFIGILYLEVVTLSSPSLDTIAAETQRIVQEDIKQRPEFKSTIVQNVKFDRQEGKDYFGTIVISYSGEKVQQSIHVHYENNQLQFQIDSPNK